MDEMPSPDLPLRSRLIGAPMRFYRYLRALLHEYRTELVLFLLFSLAALIFFLPLIFHTIPSGHVGVLWKRFDGGTVTDRTYPEGFRLTFPWDKLFVYDARLQKVEREVEVLSSDGLKIILTLVWRFHLVQESVAELHKFAGPDYAETMVTPTVGARTRDVIAVYQPEEVYTEKRLRIQRQILDAVNFDLKENFNPQGKKVIWLKFEDVLIKGMTLPPGVQEAVVRKNAMFHEMEEYTFRVKREQKEAERKRIEALGIRNFQEIISDGMNDPYLRWRGIEATLELAKSPNAKVVVIGNPKNGLPLIMNMEGKESIDGPPAPAHAATAPKIPKAQTGK
jgi:regulator of protease activity HflC (stomatin/prohibitin superfamily)